MDDLENFIISKYLIDPNIIFFSTACTLHTACAKEKRALHSSETNQELNSRISTFSRTYVYVAEIWKRQKKIHTRRGKERENVAACKIYTVVMATFIFYVFFPNGDGEKKYTSVALAASFIINHEFSFENYTEAYLRPFVAFFAL